MKDFDKWWDSIEGRKNPAWVTALAQIAWQAATERAVNTVDEELTDFLNEAPPGHYDNRLAETVDFLRGVLMDAIRKG